MKRINNFLRVICLDTLFVLDLYIVSPICNCYRAIKFWLWWDVYQNFLDTIYYHWYWPKYWTYGRCVHNPDGTIHLIWEDDDTFIKNGNQTQINVRYITNYKLYKLFNNIWGPFRCHMYWDWNLVRVKDIIELTQEEITFYNRYGYLKQNEDFVR